MRDSLFITCGEFIEPCEFNWVKGEFIYETNLIESAIQKIAKEIDEAIRNEEIRTMLVNKIISMLKERCPEILEVIFDFSVVTIKRMSTCPDEVQKHWAYTKN